MKNKKIRQNRIRNILSENVITDQKQVLRLLLKQNIKVTQATLSRDFNELGIIRKKTEFGIQYVLNQDDSTKQLAKLIGYEIYSIDNNDNLIIIRTLAGRAQGVAHFLDQLNDPLIIGTVAGDDTVIIIPKNSKLIKDIVEKLENLILSI